jgi:hypothetical protein
MSAQPPNFFLRREIHSPGSVQVPCQPKGVKPKNERRQINKWCTFTSGVKAKKRKTNGPKTTAMCTTQLSGHCTCRSTNISFTRDPRLAKLYSCVFSVPWSITPCRWVRINQRFGTVCCFHRQGCQRKMLVNNHKLGITLKMWVVRSSEKLVESNRSTLHYIPENWDLHWVYLFGSRYGGLLSVVGHWPLPHCVPIVLYNEMCMWLISFRHHSTRQNSRIIYTDCSSMATGCSKHLLQSYSCGLDCYANRSSLRVHLRLVHTYVHCTRTRVRVSACEV